MTNGKTIKRLLAAACMAALLLGLFTPMTGSVSAAGEGKHIAVVYDNSGSMYGTSNDRWSQALYAMEVFSSMLEENDEMALYPLNPQNGGATARVKGTEKPDSRIEKLVDALVNSGGGTPFDQVITAGNDLLKLTGERWLVVLTDGDFEGYSASKTRDTLQSYCSKGLKVVFLSIGSNSVDLTKSSSSDAGFFAYTSKDGPEVLEKVSTIANLIFKQQRLPENHIAISGNAMTLDLDVPVSRLVVFIQGENAMIQSLSLNGSTVRPAAVANPEITSASRPSKYKDSKIGTGLKGVINSYTGHQEAGKYTLTVSDPAKVQIFYIADVELDCILSNSDGEMNSADKHSAGTYSLEWRFVDQGGKAYTSDLLNIEACAGILTNTTTGEITNLDRATSLVSLTEGDYTLDASASLTGMATPIECHHSYVVFPAIDLLDINVLSAPANYLTAGLGSSAEPIVVRVTKSDSGDALSEAEWKVTELAVSGGNLDYEIQPGKAVSTFKIWPVCPKGTEPNTLAGGSITMILEAAYKLGNKQAYGISQSEVSFLLIGVDSLELKVLLTPPTDPVDLGTFVATEDREGNAEPNVDSLGNIVADAANVGNYIRMDLSAKNPYSGKFELLTDEQRKNLELTIQGKDAEGGELGWSVSFNDSGFWELKPNYAQIIAYSWAHVDWSNPDEGVEVQVSVAATATMTDNGFPYTGTDGPVTVMVRTMSLADLLAQILGWIIAIAVFLFLFIGYAFKKKLKISRKRASLHSVRPAGASHSVAPQRMWATYLLPYVPQRAKVNAKNKAQNCNFAELTIVATRRNGMFRIVNYQNYLATAGAKNRVAVNGVEYDKKQAKEVEKLRTKEFSSVRLEYKEFATTLGEFRIG